MIFVSGPKFINVISPNVGGVVVDNALIRFLSCRSIPEIYSRSKLKVV